MNPKTLIKEIVEDIKTLPPKDIKTIADFVDNIKDKELEDDILSSKRVIKAVKTSRKAWKTGKFADFVKWEELKRKHLL